MEADYVIDVPRLIKCVSVRPVLWDRRLKEYRLKYFKTEGWEDLCTELEPNYASFSEKDKTFLENLAFKKWKNIKDHYVKFCRKKRTGLPITKPYIYSEILAFLDPSLSAAGSDVKNEEEEEEEAEEVEEEDESAQADKEEIEMGESNRGGRDDNVEVEVMDIKPDLGSLLVNLTKNMPHSAPCKRKNTDSVNSQRDFVPPPSSKRLSLPYFGIPSTSTSVPNVSGIETEHEPCVGVDTKLDVAEFLAAKEDRHLSFFRGVLPSLKDFTDDESLQFQIETLKIVQNIKNARSSGDGRQSLIHLSPEHQRLREMTRTFLHSQTPSNSSRDRGHHCCDNNYNSNKNNSSNGRPKSNSNCNVVDGYQDHNTSSENPPTLKAYSVSSRSRSNSPESSKSFSAQQVNVNSAKRSNSNQNTPVQGALLNSSLSVKLTRLKSGNANKST